MKKLFLLSLMAMLLPLATWAEDELTVKVLDGEKEASSFVYNGTKTLENLSYKVTVTETEAEVSDFFVTITDSESKTYKATDKVGVGEYTVTIRSKEESSLGYAGTATFSVTAKEVNPAIITAKEGVTELTYQYGEDIDIKDLITINSTYLAPADDTDAELEDFISGLQIVTLGGDAFTATPDVGEYSVSVNGIKEANPSNYIYTRPGYGVTVALNITKKALILTLDGKVYNAKETLFEYVVSGGSYKFYLSEEDKEAEKEATDLKSKLTITLTYDKDAEGNEGRTCLNVGEYYVNAAVTDGDEKDHYTVSEVVTYEITKANLNITITEENAEKLTKVYGKADPKDGLTGLFTYTRDGSNDDKALTDEEVKALDLTMKRVEGEDVIYTEVEGKDGEKEVVIGGYVIFAVATANGGELLNYEIVYGTKDTPKQYFKIEPKNISIGGGAKDEEIDLTVAQEELAKILTYNGVDFTNKAESLAGVYTLEYTGVEVEELTGEMTSGTDFDVHVWNGAPINAGDMVNLTVAGKGNYTGEIWFTNLAITKAELTITAKEDGIFSKVYDGKSSGNLNTQYTFDGLQGQDADEDGQPVEGVLTMKVWDNNIGNESESTSWNVYIFAGAEETYVNPEEYQSEEPEKGLKNYKVTYVIADQQFTILPNGLTLYGGELPEGEKTNEEKIAAYAGLTVPTVTIKDLHSLMDAGYRADRWYTLVLPFETTVSEISNNFDYAIVNVPQEANNNPKSIVYKLTMGRIPAHTVMAFKVFDEYTDQNPEITFTGKTIVAAPTADEWFTDAQGNQCIGTYAGETIELANQYYVFPSDGKFYNAAAWAAQREEPMFITSFNGYFEFADVNMDPSDARILFEEADGSTTAISAVKSEKINVAEGWYTVGGVKLNAEPTEKGVYINNGKKVVIK